VKETLGVTPTKLKLICLLAVMLVAVLYLQYGRSSAEVAPTKPSARSTRAAKSDDATTSQSSPGKKENSASELVDNLSWNAPELASVIHYDPFALPAAFPQPKPTLVGVNPAEGGATVLAAAEMSEEARLNALRETQTELERLRKQGVQIILTEGDQFVAMIGKDTFHVGDEIGGFKITAIDSDGVHVERAVQE
jgi:hypothetical protein